MMVALSGWLTARDGLGIFRVFQPHHWDPGRIALVVAAVAVGGVASNLLASMIAEAGWSEAFGRHRVKAAIYTTLIVACALITTVTAIR